MQKSISFAPWCDFAYGLLAFAFFAATFSACKDDEIIEPVALATQTVSSLAADAVTPYTGSFTLYSLSNNAVVANSDSASSNWDIGFRGSTIIVNGGSIRRGAGGAYIHTGIFSELTTIADNQAFNQDNSATDLAIPTGSGNGWYSYDQATNTISPIAGKILVIRTATGKYAKLEILSYYQNAPATPTAADASRYYTFRFVYQPNGSKTF